MVSSEIAIVGGGPAGMTAGIYSARFGHQTLIVEKSFAGGQMALTSEVENYPGFSEPVNGMLLAQTMEQQAARFGAKTLNAEVTGLTVDGDRFAIATNGEAVSAGAVIIASGAKPRRLGVPGEEQLTGRGVSYCAVCDGPLFKDRDAAVVGGGDSALDEALYLSNICARVHMIHRRDEFRGCRLAQERLRARPNVTFHLSHVVKSINGVDRLESLELCDCKNEGKKVIPVSGLFIYVGWLPNTGWCAGKVDLDESGAVKTDDRLRTSVPGIFAAGDVRNTPLRQVATAVGDAALAAMMAHDYLMGKR